MTVNFVDRSRRGLPFFEPSARAARVKLARNRVAVITADAARAVRYAGGWIFDLVAVGWNVEVHSTETTDARPLRILGAQPVEFDRSYALLGRVPRPQILAVDAELYESDPWVRRRVHDAVGRLAEVTLWGYEAPAGVDEATTAHRLSLAARAFKKQALAAMAGPDETMHTTEIFHRFVRGRDPGRLVSPSVI
jgi:hypothetical protein